MAVCAPTRVQSGTDMLLRASLVAALLHAAAANDMREGVFYYDDGLPDEGGSLCTAEVDAERTTEWGESTADPMFQLYFMFPQWVAGMEVLVTLGSGFKGVDSCWNIAGLASKKGNGVLSFKLGVRPSGVHEVGCILHGIYRGGAHIGYHGFNCNAPPPPPPQHFIPCDDVEFEIISQWDSGWQARIARPPARPHARTHCHRVPT